MVSRLKLCSVDRQTVVLRFRTVRHNLRLIKLKLLSVLDKPPDYDVATGSKNIEHADISDKLYNYTTYNYYNFKLFRFGMESLVLILNVIKYYICGKMMSLLRSSNQELKEWYVTKYRGYIYCINYIHFDFIVSR